MPFHTKSGIKIDHHDQFITPSFLNANNIENINKEVYTTNFDMLKSWKKERKFISALPYWFLGMMTACSRSRSRSRFCANSWFFHKKIEKFHSEGALSHSNFLFLLCSLSLDRVSVSSDLTLVFCCSEISQK